MLDQRDLVILTVLSGLKERGLVGESFNRLATTLAASKERRASSSSRPTLRRRLRKLVNEGYLEVIRDPKHRQRKIYSITKDGKNLLAECIFPLQSWLEENQKWLTTYVSKIDFSHGEQRRQVPEEMLRRMTLGYFLSMKALAALTRYPEGASGIVLQLVLGIIRSLKGAVGELKRYPDLSSSIARRAKEARERLPEMRAMEEMGLDLLREFGID